MYIHIDNDATRAIRRAEYPDEVAEFGDDNRARVTKEFGEFLAETEDAVTIDSYEGEADGDGEAETEPEPDDSEPEDE